MTDPNSKDQGQEALFRQAVEALEWPKLLAMVADRAHSPMGAERCRDLPLETRLDAARKRLQETEEMLDLEEAGDPFPHLSFPDVREVLRRVSKGATLDPSELRDVSIALGVGLVVHRFVGLRRDSVPALAEAAAAVEDLTWLTPLKEALDRCIDPEGNIRESATPELRRLSHQAQDLKHTMRQRLEVILASKRYSDVLQERYFAQREGRYVVLLKAEMRSRIPGIVHDVSTSGATVFLEPRELVELNNSIKVAELAVQREVSRILQDLSSRVTADAGPIHLILDLLATLDSIAAKAAFSGRIKGHPVRLNDTGHIALHQARHPLLLLARQNPESVVANDIVMDERVRVLVISGPNTGGKTVTLKIVGLCALMVRAGLLPSCGADSEMPLFGHIYADVGDAQDLAKDLSSFSAHMTQMIKMIRLVQKSSHPPSSQSSSETDAPTALVLLDELATSTDPAEGAALAEALLKRLAALHTKVVVTTHYTALKALAQTTKGFMNASVGFDVPTLSPTYRLMLGVPGGSSALEIAGRLGMDRSILEEARRLLQPDNRALEQVLAELQEKQQGLSRDAERTEAMRQEAEQAAQEAAAITERLRASERDEQRRIRKKATDELLRTRAELQSVLEGLKRERTLVKASEAKQRVAEIAEQLGRAIRVAKTVPVDRLTAGDQVEIARFGTVATLLEPPKGKRRVRVRVGETEMSVDVDGLMALPAGQEKPEQPLRTSTAGLDVTSAASNPPDAGICDVRGMSGDEAVERVIAALDHAALTGTPSVRLIHGHGTGRLKSVVRSYLKSSGYVARFRPGERAEGGDGVTIAELK